jgi:hypothetical protein
VRNVAEAIVRIRGAVMTKALAGGLLPFRAKRGRDPAAQQDLREHERGAAVVTRVSPHSRDGRTRCLSASG